MATTKRKTVATKRKTAKKGKKKPSAYNKILSAVYASERSKLKKKKKTVTTEGYDRKELQKAFARASKKASATHKAVKKTKRK